MDAERLITKYKNTSVQEIKANKKSNVESYAKSKLKIESDKQKK